MTTHASLSGTGRVVRTQDFSVKTRTLWVLKEAESWLRTHSEGTGVGVGHTEQCTPWSLAPPGFTIMLAHMVRSGFSGDTTQLDFYVKSLNVYFSKS